MELWVPEVHWEQEMLEWLELGLGLFPFLFLLVVCPPSRTGFDRRVEQSDHGQKRRREFGWIELNLRRFINHK